MARNAYRIKHATALERIVVSLEIDRLESATPGFIGGLSASKQIFYDEIMTVYRFRRVDWNSLVIILLLGFIFGLIGLVLAVDNSWIGAALFWLPGLALCLWYFYRGFIQKLPIVRVIASSGTLEFPCVNADFFNNLIARLTVVSVGDVVSP